LWMCISEKRLERRMHERTMRIKPERLHGRRSRPSSSAEKHKETKSVSRQRSASAAVH
ncbi:Uncharacterized protein DAT39_019772, partial [Clarias magur]